jgi:hypothetical protein
MNEKLSPTAAGESLFHTQRRVEKKTDSRSIIFYSFTNSTAHLTQTGTSAEHLPANQEPSEARLTDIKEKDAQ